jgi:L-fucose mutarotase
MLLHQLLHPRINEVLGRAGHTSKVLIADGNYPAATTLGPSAELVSLNLSPGVVSCTQVLSALLSAIPVERINTMQPQSSGPYAMDGDPPVWVEYRRALEAAGGTLDLEPIERWDFYKAVNTPDLALTIQTADQNLYANILLTIGVRQP